MPQAPSGAFTTIAPDWVCEALSPSTARTDRVLKVPLDARELVPFVWLVDAAARTLEILKLQGEGYLLLKTFGGLGNVRAEPFNAIELELDALWDE